MPSSARITRSRRALALAAALTVVGGAGLTIALAETAGATPAPRTAATQNPHIVAMAPAPTSSAAPHSSVPPATRPAASSSSPRSGTAPGTATAAPPPASQARQVQLSSSQLPAVAAEQWKPVGSPSTRTIAGHEIRENECAAIDGASTWVQQGFAGGGNQNVAVQDTFLFSSSTAARTAYQQAVAGMQACQQTTRALQASNKVTQDAVVRRTAAGSDSTAWQRAWTGVMGLSADGPQTNHLYFAVNGTRLVALQFTEFGGSSTPYNAAADPQILAMLTTELAQ